MKKFYPGDYVITQDGKKGYIVDQHISQDSIFYSIRLTHGYIFKSVEEIELDFSSGKNKKISF